MCLKTIDAAKPEPEGTGWKLFWLLDGSFPFENIPLGIYGMISMERREIGHWLVCEESGLPEGPGFHIYPNKNHIYATQKVAGAFRDTPLVMHRVKYRGATVSGRGDGWTMDAEVVVAREMFILEEETCPTSS